MYPYKYREAIRGCGTKHIGVCWTERLARWAKANAWIPPEHRDQSDLFEQRCPYANG